ncbi:pantoate--beta-alanine ligase [Candidatus Kinetoplastibacterium blastocrithidii TCC012E]|uniref:Pantothenate synthetase n=1 Tax=Candidatus Kinetoplastidibacterium blastocrithidiae TCC012E TaxID=1208922 RepID=M1LWZ6_9PROT|nr:pantoate--beta-alanine ligase [Candidatus Kinetoplastibacterium blastocrithidii]AFZ83233.1 pantoate--beta-alanine ligase [Candidatus Kinetoplastibacterium blastocrithidii (ex Strigomonas culicis)]AGF50047.1 pantoate--beta-alanine ligase [Candidatus Kinetoplastibacterium blastocrithidii TCC012E]
MKIIYSVSDLHKFLSMLNAKISFVPTMGSLHRGHLELVDLAKGTKNFVVVSIFVNRLQFGPNEDFDKYPRSIENDINILANHAKTDLLFIPDEREIYPEPQNFYVNPPNELGNILEGEVRKGFFSGVCTVLMKLFSLIRPDTVVLGKKDYQQLIIVRSMCKQFLLSTNIIGHEIVREKRGLAFSSRNKYLNEDQISLAPMLYTVLNCMRQKILDNSNLSIKDLVALELEATRKLEENKWFVNYITVRKQLDLSLPSQDDLDNQINVPLVILGAAFIGNVRLIDNLEI